MSVSQSAPGARARRYHRYILCEDDAALTLHCYPAPHLPPAPTARASFHPSGPPPAAPPDARCPFLRLFLLPIGLLIAALIFSVIVFYLLVLSAVVTISDSDGLDFYVILLGLVSFLFALVFVFPFRENRHKHPSHIRLQNSPHPLRLQLSDSLLTAASGAVQVPLNTIRAFNVVLAPDRDVYSVEVAALYHPIVFGQVEDRDACAAVVHRLTSFLEKCREINVSSRPAEVLAPLLPRLDTNPATETAPENQSTATDPPVAAQPAEQGQTPQPHDSQETHVLQTVPARPSPAYHLFQVTHASLPPTGPPPRSGTNAVFRGSHTTAPFSLSLRRRRRFPARWTFVLILNFPWWFTILFAAIEGTFDRDWIVWFAFFLVFVSPALLLLFWYKGEQWKFTRKGEALHLKLFRKVGHGSTEQITAVQIKQVVSGDSEGESVEWCCKEAVGGRRFELLFKEAQDKLLFCIDGLNEGEAWYIAEALRSEHEIMFSAA